MAPWKTPLLRPLLAALLFLSAALPLSFGEGDDLTVDGLNVLDARISADDLAFRGESTRFLTPMLGPIRRRPFLAGDYARLAADSLARNASSLRPLLTSALIRTGCGSYRGWLDDPSKVWRHSAAGYDALEKELVRLFAAAGKKWPARYTRKLKHDWADVPPELVEAVTVFLRAAASALRWRDEAFASLRASGDPAAVFSAFVSDMAVVRAAPEGATPPAHPVEDSSRLARLLPSVDFNCLYTGALEVALALDDIRASLAPLASSAGEFAVSLDTPLGRISLGGVGENYYADDVDHLLIIDLGGDDNYRGGGASLRWDFPLSCVLDFSGDDIYFNERVGRPAFGAGLFGYGFLLDCAGDDYYKSSCLSLGCGLFGVGMVYDAAGKDTYSCISYGEGSGSFGAGVLCDLSGDDGYSAYRCSQAYASTLSVGVLLDLAGSDTYTAEDSDVRFPSPQSSKHNANLCQGAGFGIRADYLDGRSWGGGIALLVDCAGDDRYSAGVFAQGVGYWGGVGVLLDRAGNDRYSGVWYVMAASAHFAAAVFLDDAGNDSYRASMNAACGAGHDYSVSFFRDGAGDDAYEMPNLSLGAGNANGIGIFIEAAGNDRYSARGVCLGAAAGGRKVKGIRAFSLTLGVFLDLGGKDAYPSKGISPRDAPPADGARWTHKRSKDAPPSEKGLGMDVSPPALSFLRGPFIRRP